MVSTQKKWQRFEQTEAGTPRFTLVAKRHFKDDEQFQHALEGRLFLSRIPADATLPGVVVAEQNFEFDRRNEGWIDLPDSGFDRFFLLIEQVIDHDDKA